MSIDEDNISTLLSSASLILVGQLLFSVSKLGERIIIAQMLTPQAYGEVSIGLAVVMISTTVALVGLRQGVPRYISRYDDARDIRGAWVTGILIAGVIGSVVAIGLAVETETVVGLLFEQADSTGLLFLFAVAIPFVIGMQVGIGAIRGFENTLYRTYTRDLLYPGLRIAALVVFLWAGFGILAAGYAYLIAAVTTFVAVHVLLNRLIPLVGEVRTHVREMLTFSIPLVISTLLSRLLTRTDTLMLGYFDTSYQVGLYNAAFPLASALVLVLSSFGFMYLPMASRLDAENKREEVDAIYKVTTKWIYIVTFPGFLTMVVFSRDVIAVTFGAEYTPASTALSILALGFFTRATFGRSRETLSAFGHTTYLLVTNSFAFVLNIGLNLFLIPRYGSTGAAVASAVSFIGLNVAVFAFLSRQFGVSPFSRWTRRTVVVLPVCLFPPALVLDSQISLTLVPLVVFVAVAELAAIAVVTVTGCLQPEDEILIEFVENRIGIDVPLIRQYVTDST
ncbi:flippase [Halorientalis brevis]|uniref:Flippase n=1 Tax=Halorientalis brevis TaxID=1126241 RepID=A0ABD6CDI2_9EURY|nr:flippase [Halorientalis brevis]